jgi:hypothetical protein
MTRQQIIKNGRVYSSPPLRHVTVFGSMYLCSIATQYPRKCICGDQRYFSRHIAPAVHLQSAFLRIQRMRSVRGGSLCWIKSRVMSWRSEDELEDISSTHWNPLHSLFARLLTWSQDVSVSSCNRPPRHIAVLNIFCLQECDKMIPNSQVGTAQNYIRCHGGIQIPFPCCENLI